MRAELSASRVRPFGEKLKRRASPLGNAADELVEMETSLIVVSRGLRYALKRFRRASHANRPRSRGRSSVVNGPEITL